MDNVTVIIKPLSEQHRKEWETLARGYKQFYGTPTTDREYEDAWSRILQRKYIHGLGAFVDDELVGIAHYVLEHTTWAERNCYLQDLFTAPAMRGKGIARKLIETVASEALLYNCDKYYWQTKQDNTVARGLYDKIARFNGFIRYHYDLR